MFQIGELVVYGFHGVCRVLEQEARIIDRKQVIYLVLEPIGHGGSRYLVPTHNTAAMSKLQHILSREELNKLLDSHEIRADGWIRDENQRKQTYRDLINSGDRAKLLQMVRTLYVHKANQLAAGRKCHMCDENFLRDAEKLLVSELAIVLHLEPEEAKKYLKAKLKEDA